MKGSQLKVDCGETGVVLRLPQVDVRLSPADLAKAFSVLADQSQADFFVALAHEFDSFDDNPGSTASFQACRMGAELGFHKEGARAVELLKLMLEVAEENIVKRVMDL